MRVCKVIGVQTTLIHFVEELIYRLVQQTSIYSMYLLREYVLTYTQRAAQKFMPSTLPSSLVLGWYAVLFCVCRDVVLYITIIYVTKNN